MLSFASDMSAFYDSYDLTYIGPTYRYGNYFDAHFLYQLFIYNFTLQLVYARGKSTLIFLINICVLI